MNSVRHQRITRILLEILPTVTEIKTTEKLEE